MEQSDTRWGKEPRKTGAKYKVRNWERGDPRSGVLRHEKTPSDKVVVSTPTESPSVEDAKKEQPSSEVVVAENPVVNTPAPTSNDDLLGWREVRGPSVDTTPDRDFSR